MIRGRAPFGYGSRNGSGVSLGDGDRHDEGELTPATAGQSACGRADTLRPEQGYLTVRISDTIG